MWLLNEVTKSTSETYTKVGCTSAVRLGAMTLCWVCFSVGFSIASFIS